VWKPIAAKEETQTLHVHPEHEAAVRDYFARQRRSSGPVLYTVLGVTLLLAVLGNALGPLIERLPATVGAAVTVSIGALIVVLGGLLFFRPLPTDTTLKSFGIRRSVQAVRVVSTLTVALGGWVVSLGVGPVL
jgi:ethanolamine transporter EutH